MDRVWTFIPGEQVVRHDHELDDDAVMTVVSDSGGRYVNCVYNKSQVDVAHPYFRLRSWQPTTED